MVGPAEFIPLAEKSDLILEIGEWVLRRACEEVQHWGQGPDGPVEVPRISVNVSGRQLKEAGFPALVERVLNETGMDPKNLELELTETVMIESLERTPAVVTELAGKGIGIAIDDFGTGYSSMSYLTKLTAQVIKLDRSLVTHVARKRNSASLAKGMIGLAHDLGLTVIAEGVEQEQQMEFLRTNGCDLVQGYLTGRPMPADSFRQLLTLDRPLVSPLLARPTVELSEAICTNTTIH